MKEKTVFLKREIGKNGLEKTWMKLLKTHIKNYTFKTAVEDFSENKDFKNYSIYEEDILNELSLAEISTLFEYSLAVFNKALRKETGAYYTPGDVADFIAGLTESFEEGVWLDPASGIGNLSYALTLKQKDPEAFILNNLLLQDLNPLALKIAQVLFALRFQKNVNNFYEKIASRFIVKDFLEDYHQDLYKPVGLFTEKPPAPNYNYIIVNPPYLSTKIDERFITGESRDIYAYFLEKIILTSDGFVSVTPQSFLNSKKFRHLRKLFINNFNEVDFFVFDNIPDSIFKGYKYGSNNSNSANSVRATITVARKSIKQNYKITPFLRWRTSERKEAFNNFQKMLTSFTPEEELFPKLSNQSKSFYNRIQKNKTFSALISSEPTEFSLRIPSTPRYFISAVKRKLHRGSLIEIFFKNEGDLNYAYMLLNSAYFYWWWRVVDGGLTLSKTTLYSLPLINFSINEDLIKELEDEENDLTIKMNAGLANENVKHSAVLVRGLSDYIFNEELAEFNECIVEEFLKFSKNSFLS